MAERIALPPHKICESLKNKTGKEIRLSIQDLEPADVLLSYTQGGDGLWVASWWVRAIEKGCYSHAALYDGQGSVIEAKSPADDVVRSPLQTKPYQYADVFRFQWADSAAAQERRAVVDSAGKFVGKRFGVGNAILVGLLALTRRVDLPGGLEDSLRRVLDAATSLLTRLVSDGRDFLTCSELVYRAYADSRNQLSIGPLHPNRSEAIQSALGQADGTTRGWETPAIQEQLSRFAKVYLSHREQHRLALVGEKQVADAPDFVTPLDLQTSPSLERVGRLELESARSFPSSPAATHP